MPNIKERLYNCNVALKSITLNKSCCTGVVIKDTMPGSVVLRWTADNWRTINNTFAVEYSGGEFRFNLATLPGTVLKMAAQFCTFDAEHWGNNNHNDFIFNCISVFNCMHCS